jgi:hypothetical protein
MHRGLGRVVVFQAALSGFLLAAAGPLLAQAGLEVAVFSQGTAQPLAGIEVRVENPQTHFFAKDRTNAQGKVRFPALSTAGAYTVGIDESDAFYAAKAGDLVLRSNFDRSVTLSLTPKATVAEAITVTARDSIAEVNAVNDEVSSTLSQNEIETLAVEGRDITRVLYRLPNVTQATGFYPEAPNVSVNGANSLYTSYLIDGLDNNENFLGGQKFAVPLGFVQEVTVLTSNYSVEFGRTGNGIFNVTSRSGGNDRGGEVFYLGRPGPSIDAHSPFAQRDLSGNGVKDGFQRNQGGVAFGGPILKDRTFFFVDAEYTQDRKDNLLTSPELGVHSTVRGHNTFGYFSGKLDERWNDRWTTSLRVNEGLVTIENQGGGLDGGVTFPSAGSHQDRDSTLLAAKTTYAGNAFVSESSAQYSRFRWNYTRPQRKTDPQTTVFDPSGQTIAVLGNPGGLFDDTENTFELQQKFVFSTGRHTFKVGANLESAHFALVGGGNPNGNYTVQLTDAQLAAVAALGKGAGLGVNDIPKDARVLDYNVELQANPFGKRQNLFGLYLEDLLALTPRLNLTLGLRYDYDTLSKGGASSGDGDNVGPRVALNYRLGDGSVLRGGWGLFYDKVVYSIVSDALQQSTTSAGFRSQIQQLIDLGIVPAGTPIDGVIFNGNISADFPGGVGYLTAPTSGQLQSQRELVTNQELRILNPSGYDNPKTQQFSLGYQRQLGKKHLFYVDLIHAQTKGLPRLFDLNAPAPDPIDPSHVVVRTPEQANATRPVPLVPGGARGIIVTQDAGIARYDAASVNLVKEAGSQRFWYRVSYTLSRLRNNTDDINFRAQDANNFNTDYGPSLNDRTHVVSAILFGRPLKGLTASLAGLFQSGQPVNRIPDARIFGTTDLNGDGHSYGDAYDGNSDRWPGAPRNKDRLPWSTTLDLGVRYRVPFGRGAVEVEADVFNLLNRTNLSGYSNNATQSNQIQLGPPGGPIVEKNAGPPRQFQFGMRYTF